MSKTGASNTFIKSVTLQDIADRCGVSNVTVSRALRGDQANVSKSTIDRVIKVAKELGYNQSQQHNARRLALQKYGIDLPNNIISLVFPRHFTTMPYFVQGLLGIMDVLSQSVFGLLTNYQWDPESEEPPQIFDRGDIDGVILGVGSATHDNGESPIAAQLRNLPAYGTRPILSMINPYPGCSAILLDDFSGGYQAACHLLELGHRHLLMCSQGGFVHERRVAGCRQAYQNHLLNPDVYLNLIDWRYPEWEDDTAWHAENNERNLWRALQEHPKITAILAPNDMTAITINDILGRLGKRVPEDISLIGYDDTDPLLGGDGNNILTTIRVPMHEAGAAAARMMMKLVSEGKREELTEVLPVKLVVRDTTAPCRSV